MPARRQSAGETVSCPRCDETDFAAFAADPRAPEWSALRDHYPRCAECAAEVARWSRLTGALAGAGDAARSAHPAEAQLLAYQSQPGGLERAERAAIETHLAGCAPCRSELNVLARFDFGALAAGAALAASQEASEPSLGERIGRMLDAIGDRLFGGLARPVLVAAALLALALPAALLGWWASSHDSPNAQPAPIARVEPTPAAVEPPPRVAPSVVPSPAPPAERIARAPSPDAEPPSSVAPEPPAPEPELSPESEPSRVAGQPAPIPSRQDPTPPAPIQIAALLPDELPIYQPDLALAGGSLASIRSGAVVRAGGSGGGPEIFALGPDHVGATREAGPVLYWYLSGESELPIELSISAENGIEPLLEQRIEPPVDAGVHAWNLADHGVILAPGITHHWFATLVRDPDNRDADVTSEAAVRRTPGGSALEARLERAGPADQANVLAAFGYWYDAFDTLSAWSAAEPEAAALRRHRAALLEQVGLAGVARAALSR